MRLHLPAALIVAVVIAMPALAQGADRSVGIWRNPQNSVHVRSDHCGESMCGTVVWANDKAKADAARGGTETLVGSQLFRDFRKDKRGNWRGRVFVPDINQTFSGRIEVIDARTLKGSGCLVGGIGCKSQTWTRIE